MDTNGDQETNIGHLFNSEPAAAPAPQPATEQPLPPDVTESYQSPPLPVAAESVATPAPVPVAPPPPQTVPLAELIETRRRAQEAEAQARQLTETLHRFTQPQQPQPQVQPKPVIDPEIDPAGAYNALREEMHTSLLTQNLNVAERYARKEYGDAVVDAAVQAALDTGYNQAFLRQPDPYKATIEWYQGQQAMRQIGTDPVAYRAQIEADVRAKVIAEMRAGSPPPSNLPPSLSTATRVNSAPDLAPSGKDFFKDMMTNPPRNR